MHGINCVRAMRAPNRYQGSALMPEGFPDYQTTLDFSSHPPGAGADVTMNKLRVVDSECGAHDPWKPNPVLLMNHAHP